MRKKILLLLTFLPCFAYSQQESKIKIDSGNKNEITVIQSGKDTSQKSDIDIQHSDSNKAQINQRQEDNAIMHKKPSGFQKFISNTNNLFVLLISIATFIGLVWKGIPFFKKTIQKK